MYQSFTEDSRDFDLITPQIQIEAHQHDMTRTIQKHMLELEEQVKAANFALSQRPNTRKEGLKQLLELASRVLQVREAMAAHEWRRGAELVACLMPVSVQSDANMDEAKAEFERSKLKCCEREFHLSRLEANNNQALEMLQNASLQGRSKWSDSLGHLDLSPIDTDLLGTALAAANQLKVWTPSHSFHSRGHSVGFRDFAHSCLLVLLFIMPGLQMKPNPPGDFQAGKSSHRGQHFNLQPS